MVEFRMPSLGADMAAGTLLEWRVKPGDLVKRRDIIAVVDTDKAAIEIEVYADGVVEALLVQPGMKVPVGTVMAIIRSEAARTPEVGKPGVGETPPGLHPPQPLKVEKTTSAAEDAPTGAPPPAAPAVRVKASPYARRLAAEHGVDLKTLTPGKPHGSICATDVKQAMAAAPSPPPKEISTAVPQAPPPAGSLEAHLTAAPIQENAPVWGDPTAMRRAIAGVMARSNREIPHYYLQTRLDMSRTLAWLESENRKRSIQDRLLPVVPLIKAVELALQDVPELNGYWIDDRHQPQEAINIGFAISLRRGGLIAPAILGADLLTVDELMAALRDLITRTRAGRLRSAEMSAATISLSNLGDLGVEAVFGVIYPPQVALVGFGKTMQQPWAENGLLGVRPVLTATLAADHRATDGHQGAQFLDALNRCLQEPSTL
ncbi:MAG: dihydrolipoamide acetyltransferase family protein [Desulfobacterales bacterium]